MEPYGQLVDRFFDTVMIGYKFIIIKLMKAATWLVIFFIAWVLQIWMMINMNNDITVLRARVRMLEIKGNKRVLGKPQIAKLSGDKW